MIPKDPMILLSYVNTQLRDHYASLAMLCAELEINQEELVEQMKKIDYQYDERQNRFV